MKTLVILIALVACAVAGIDDKCLKCICNVESNCNEAQPCVMDEGSESCGAYQLKDVYWQDCGKPGGSWKECASKKDCSEKCVKAYLDKYADKCKSNPDCETYARVHNRGPQGCKNPASDWYWDKIKKCLG